MPYLVGFFFVCVQIINITEQKNAKLRLCFVVANNQYDPSEKCPSWWWVGAGSSKIHHRPVQCLTEQAASSHNHRYVWEDF